MVVDVNVNVNVVGEMGMGRDANANAKYEIQNTKCGVEMMMKAIPIYTRKPHDVWYSLLATFYRCPCTILPHCHTHKSPSQVPDWDWVGDWDWSGLNYTHNLSTRPLWLQILASWYSHDCRTACVGGRSDGGREGKHVDKYFIITFFMILRVPGYESLNKAKS